MTDPGKMPPNLSSESLVYWEAASHSSKYFEGTAGSLTPSERVEAALTTEQSYKREKVSKAGG